MAQAIQLGLKGLEVWLLESGEDLQESLERLAMQRGVHSAVLLSGFGSLATLTVRNPAGDQFPPPMQSKTEAGPFELLSITGTIGEVAVKGDTVHGKVHAHIAVSGKDGRVLGGSITVGCKVFWKVQVNVALTLPREAS
ncbi:MAG: PPC domain-containing DNA-binding protein [Bacillota bacterium]